jgi:uncharacterized protein
LDGQEEFYPLDLEERYARVMNRIVDLWDTKEIDDYFTELMIGNRGGTRQGFPKELPSEIFALSMAHAKIRDKKQQAAAGGNPWEDVEASKKSAVEQQGYAFPPQWFRPVSRKGRPQGRIIVSEQRGVDIDTRDEHGWTPLLQAATRSHLLAAGQLIAGGADVNLPSTDGWTPLHKAATNGHIEMVKLLLAKGAYRSPEYQDGTTPLKLAIKNKHKEIEALLTAKL